MSNNKELDEKLERLKASKKDETKNDMVDEFTGTKDMADQMKQIAAQLKKQKEEKQSSLNDDYVKDTIYIERNIYEAFNALCIKQGDKKKFANEAFADYVMKRYNQMQ